MDVQLLLREKSYEEYVHLNHTSKTKCENGENYLSRYTCTVRRTLAMPPLGRLYQESRKTSKHMEKKFRLKKKKVQREVS